MTEVETSLTLYFFSILRSGQQEVQAAPPGLVP